MSAASLDDKQAAYALTVAQEAARAAGQVLLRHFEALELSGIDHKSSRRDLVSKADVAAERVIVEHLRRCLPGHAIEAEEEVRDAAADDRPRWFVDPLDGTVNFIQGVPLFCVSLGLYCQGEPQVAVVYVPKLDEMYFAQRGKRRVLGAWQESPHLGGERQERTDRGHSGHGLSPIGAKSGSPTT